MIVLNFETICKQRKIPDFLTKSIIHFFSHPTTTVKLSLDRAEKIIASKKSIVYIGGALTGHSEKVKKYYEQTGKLIDKLGGFGYVPHVYGTDPVKHPNVSPEEVRNIDFLWSVLLPKANIFWCDNPSLGVGIEMGWAETYQISSFKVYGKKNIVSRLPRGLYNSEQIVYAKISEAYHEIKKKIIKYL